MQSGRPQEIADCLLAKWPAFLHVAIAQSLHLELNHDLTTDLLNEGPGASE